MKGICVMLEYTVNLNSVSKLLRLRRIVMRHQLHGYVQQKYFRTGLRSNLMMMIGLPLNEMKVTISDCPPAEAPEVLRELEALAG